MRANLQDAPISFLDMLFQSLKEKSCLWVFLFVLFLLLVLFFFNRVLAYCAMAVTVFTSLYNQPLEPCQFANGNSHLLSPQPWAATIRLCVSVS